MKHDFESSGMSLKRIGEKHGISDRRVGSRAKKSGWSRLVGTKPLRRGPVETAAPKKQKRSKPAKPQRGRLIARLLQALDKGLMQLETRMESDTGAAPLSAADAERDARTLSGLARLYQKLVELDEQERSGREAEATTEAAKDAEDLRRDLALRLQRLNQARASR